MKLTILAAALAFSLVAGTAFAHPQHATAEGNQAWQGGPMMMGKGAGMRGPSGQGRGMMGMHGTGTGMMGMHGMGRAGNPEQCLTGQGMYGPGMMRGHHWMMESAQVGKRDAFLDATKELRKNLHDKKFEYMEASRNPVETVGSLREKGEELGALQQELQTKRKEFFTNN